MRENFKDSNSTFPDSRKGKGRAEPTIEKGIEAVREDMMRHLGGYRRDDALKPSDLTHGHEEMAHTLDDEIKLLSDPERLSIHAFSDNRSKIVSEDSEFLDSRKGKGRAEPTTEEGIEALPEEMMGHLGDYRRDDALKPSDLTHDHEEMAHTLDDEIRLLFDPERLSVHAFSDNRSKIVPEDSEIRLIHREMRKGKYTFWLKEGTKARREFRKYYIKTFYQNKMEVLDLINETVGGRKSISNSSIYNLNQAIQEYLDQMLSALHNIYKTVAHKEHIKSSSYKLFKKMKETYEVCENIGELLRAQFLHNKYETSNITELYKKATDPVKKDEIKEIKILHKFIYITDNNRIIEGTELKDVDLIEVKELKYYRYMFISDKIEKELLGQSLLNTLNNSGKRIKGPSRFYNCFSKTFTDDESSWLEPEHTKTALKDNGYYPIAGWSRNGDHPNPGCRSKEGYFPITSSNNDLITEFYLIDGRKANQPQNGDVIIYWKRNTDGDFIICHSAEISRIDGDTYYAESKFGDLGVYEHACDDICDSDSEYGENWTIYHSDRHNRPLLQKSEQQESDPLSILRENDFRVIARSNRKLDPNPEEQPQNGDRIVYWIENPYTQEWSLVDTGLVSGNTDGRIFVHNEVNNENRELGADPGFPYTRWEICRIDNQPQD